MSLVELFFIPIGLLAFLMGFVVIFIAVILVLDIAALFSLPLSIYRAVKNFNYVSTKALFDFSDEEDEEDYE